MKLSATLRAAGAAFLLSAAVLPAVAASPSAVAGLVVDKAVDHPSFTVRVVGQGPALLLIPGLTCPGSVWNETVAHYQRQYQCHVISLAGFGGVPATATPDPALLQTVRDQLLTYISAQQLQKPIIIGHSLGGFLGLWLSVTRPEAVGPLVILDSLPFMSAVQNPALTAEQARPMAEGMRQQMQRGKLPVAAQRQMVAGLMTDTARISQATRWGQESDPRTVSQAMYDLMTTDLRAELGRIQQPALVLGAWAAYQQYGATLESTKAIFTQQYAKLPQVRVEMSAAGKHFLMWDDQAWFFAQTDAFLQQHRPAAPLKTAKRRS